MAGLLRAHLRADRVLVKKLMYPQVRSTDGRRSSPAVPANTTALRARLGVCQLPPLDAGCPCDEYVPPLSAASGSWPTARAAAAACQENEPGARCHWAISPYSPAV